MSGYRHDYPLAPAPRSGWGSAFTSIAAAAVIAVVSGIGGAAVVLELVAPSQNQGDAQRMSVPQRAVLPATVSPVTISVGQPKTGFTSESGTKTARDMSDRPVRVIASGSTVGAAIDDNSKDSATPATAAAATPVPAQPSPAVASAASQTTSSEAAVESDSSGVTSASDLTFARGYAKRRAAREASMKTAEPPKDDVKETKQIKKPEKVARAKRRIAPETAVAQSYELPDGRRVTVYRNYRGDRGEYAARSERRETSGFASSFGFGDGYPRPMRRVQGPGLFGEF